MVCCCCLLLLLLLCEGAQAIAHPPLVAVVEVLKSLIETCVCARAARALRRRPHVLCRRRPSSRMEAVNFKLADLK